MFDVLKVVWQSNSPARAETLYDGSMTGGMERSPHQFRVHAIPHEQPRRSKLPGFTLVELLVVVAVLSALVGLLMPALARARAGATDLQCASNVRQIGVVFWSYASENDTMSPAIGQPYIRSPNWRYVVNLAHDGEGQTYGRIRGGSYIQICPNSKRAMGEDTVNSYAMNATGLAGLAAGALYPGSRADRGDYNSALRPAFVRMSQIRNPGALPMISEAAQRLDAPIYPGYGRLPIAYAEVDYRQPAHRAERMGRFHRDNKEFTFVAYDGSAGSHAEIPEVWQTPLP